MSIPISLGSQFIPEIVEIIESYYYPRYIELIYNKVWKHFSKELIAKVLEDFEKLNSDELKALDRITKCYQNIHLTDGVLVGPVYHVRLNKFIHIMTTKNVSNLKEFYEHSKQVVEISKRYDIELLDDYWDFNFVEGDYRRRIRFDVDSGMFSVYYQKIKNVFIEDLEYVSVWRIKDINVTHPSLYSVGIDRIEKLVVKHTFRNASFNRNKKKMTRMKAHDFMYHLVVALHS